MDLADLRYARDDSLLRHLRRIARSPREQTPRGLAEQLFQEPRERL